MGSTLAVPAVGVSTGEVLVFLLGVLLIALVAAGLIVRSHRRRLARRP